jgi:hypothetical protein
MNKLALMLAVAVMGVAALLVAGAPVHAESVSAVDLAGLWIE